LLELNPGPKIAEQVRGVLATCEKSPTDAIKINYDPRNPFDICSVTFSAIYKVRVEPGAEPDLLGIDQIILHSIIVMTMQRFACQVEFMSPK
jgi:hypothetical protein